MADRIFVVYDRAASSTPGPLRDDPLASGWRRVRDPAAARFVVANLDLFTLNSRDPAAVISASSRYPGETEYFTQLNPRSPYSRWPSLFVPLRILVAESGNAGGLWTDPGILRLLSADSRLTPAQLARERAQAESQAAQRETDDALARAQARKISSWNWDDLTSSLRSGWLAVPSEGKLVVLSVAALAVVVLVRRA